MNPTLCHPTPACRLLIHPSAGAAARQPSWRLPYRAEAARVIRGIEASDAPAFQAFVMQLSTASRRMRFHGALKACTPGLLKQLTDVDGVGHQAWVAVERQHGSDTVIGEARFVGPGRDADAELAIAVADDRRGQGIADALMQTLIAAADRSGVRLLYGDVLDGNVAMFQLLRRHGFAVRRTASASADIVRWQRLRPDVRVDRPAWQ